MPRILITSANAREMNARSQAARKARIEALRQTIDTLSHHPQTDYTSIRLARVRLQLDRIDAMMLEEKDPQKLDRLAAASMRLSDQEFALAGRHKPGNLRPTSNSTRRAAPSAGPLGLADSATSAATFPSSTSDGQQTAI